eukprot:3786950-Rhodomonas_salina.2
MMAFFPSSSLSSCIRSRFPCSTSARLGGGCLGMLRGLVRYPRSRIHSSGLSDTVRGCMRDGKVEERERKGCESEKARRGDRVGFRV